MKARASLAGDAAISFLGQISGYAATIVLGIVIARSLGPAGKGVTALAAMLLTIFTTFGNGLQAAMLFQAGRNGAPLTAVYGAALRWTIGLFVPAALAVFAYAHLHPEHAVAAYVAVAIPFAVFVQIANGVFLVAGSVRSTVIAGSFSTFGFALAAIPALLVWHAATDTVLLIWSAMNVLSACYAFARIRTLLPASSLAADARLFREQGWYALKAGSVNAADFLNLRVDVFVVGALLGARELGIYSLAVATGELMWQVSRPLVWSSLGRIATYKRRHSISLVATMTRNIVAIECVIGVFVFALAPVAVRFVYGEPFAEAGTLVRWLLPGLIVYAAHGGFGYFIQVKDGRPGTILIIQTVSLVTCAAITVATIPHFGLVGAAIATSVTYCFSAGLKALIFLRSTHISAAAVTLPRRSDVHRSRRLVHSLTTKFLARGARASSLT